VTVLREAGVAACPRCAAIHGSDDRFCPGCGIPMGRRADRPIAVASGGPPMAQAPAQAISPPPSASHVPGQTSMELPGSPSPLTPPLPSTRSFSQEASPTRSDLLRPPAGANPTADGEEQPTRIIKPSEPLGDLRPGAPPQGESPSSQ
jgi:hypothetical protein